MQEFPLFAQIGFVQKGETYIFAGHQKYWQTNLISPTLIKLY